jgi:hypothetical protein
MARRPSALTSAMGLTGVCLLTLGLIQVAGYEAAGAVTPPDTGFSQPFAGTPDNEYLAPTKVTDSDRLHEPIGRHAADQIARELGLTEADTFTNKQYREFISGKGEGAEPASAALVDASVRIFTNTNGRPLYSNIDGHITPTVLASYGLFVTTNGLLESLAQKDAPTRRANQIIAPGGYLGSWCRANGCERSLAALYRSAYTAEVVYGTASQQISEPAQIVENQLGPVPSKVGMSMVPSIWIVNFLLLYLLNPSVAAEMPAKWAPIPPKVALAIDHSLTGQVAYSAFASDLH